MVRSIRVAAARMSSCSHIRITVQPAFLRRRFVSRSRRTLVSIFSRHQSALFLGQVPCLGQPCQKQPSRSTAIFCNGKVMSTVRRLPSMSLRCSLKRRPRRCSSDRRDRSRELSRCAVPDIRLDVWGATGCLHLGLIGVLRMMSEIACE